jgi:hypothetical protein
MKPIESFDAFRQKGVFRIESPFQMELQEQSLRHDSENVDGNEKTCSFVVEI